MPFADPDKAREYNREYQRKKRQEQKDTPAEKPATNLPEISADEIRTAKGLLDLLSGTIAAVHESDTEILTKARVIGYLVGVGLKAVETASLEERLQRLESDKGRADTTPTAILKQFERR